MQKGDIVFYKSNGSWWDIFIKIVSPNYTHVGFALNSNAVIAANINGVTITPLECLCDVKIKRFKKVSMHEIDEGANYAYLRRHEPYSISQAVAAGVFRLLRIRHEQSTADKWWFCSEFVARIIKEGMGRSSFLSNMDPNDILPDDIDKSSELFELSDIKQYGNW